MQMLSFALLAIVKAQEMKNEMKMVKLPADMDMARLEHPAHPAPMTMAQTPKANRRGGKGGKGKGEGAPPPPPPMMGWGWGPPPMMHGGWGMGGGGMYG